MRLFRRRSQPDAEAEATTERALARTRGPWFGRLGGLLRGSSVDEELWEVLEEVLIGADAGVSMTLAVLDRVRAAAPRSGEEVRGLLRDELTAILSVPAGGRKGRLWSPPPEDGTDGGEPSEQPTPPEPPAVVLVVGVNGSGKTTGIAKLAHAYQQEGERVLCAAADTYRAAAIEQLQTWGERLGFDVVAHQQGADAAAVAFDAIDAARARGAGVILIDTAGRLQNKQHLMDELTKMKRVIERNNGRGPDEVLLVLDATTGQNGLSQARAFTEAVEVTAVMLAKLDGTAKGGIVFAIASELDLPVRFVGTGQEEGDLAPFDPGPFVEALLAEPAAAEA